MASHKALRPTPTILEGQELKDTVDDGHDDGERQQVGVGLQEGDLGRGWGDGREHPRAPARADRSGSPLAGPSRRPPAPEEPDDKPTGLTLGLPGKGRGGQEDSRPEMGRWAQSGGRGMHGEGGGKWGEKRDGGDSDRGRQSNNEESRSEGQKPNTRDGPRQVRPRPNMPEAGREARCSRTQGERAETSSRSPEAGGRPWGRRDRSRPRGPARPTEKPRQRRPRAPQRQDPRRLPGPEAECLLPAPHGEGP